MIPQLGILLTSVVSVSELLLTLMAAAIGVTASLRTFFELRAVSHLRTKFRIQPTSQEEIEQFLTMVAAAEETGPKGVAAKINGSANTVAQAISSLDVKDRESLVSILASPSNKARREFISENVLISTERVP